MGFSLAGAAAAYQGVRDDQERTASEDRKAKAELRAEQEAAFQEETRGRQRKDWSKADKIEANKQKDIDELTKAFADDSAAIPSASTGAPVAQAKTDKSSGQSAVSAEVPTTGAMDAGTPGVPPTATAGSQTSADVTMPLASPALAAVAKPVGIKPPVRNFNNALAMQQELLRRQLARGELDANSYAQNMSAINRYQKEGVNDAMELFAQGRYQDGVDKFNSTGQMKGAKIVGGYEGTTKINGIEVPTHFVTMQNADGSRTTMDVAKARSQLMEFKDQITSAAQGKQLSLTEQQNKDSNQLARDQLRQQGEIAKQNLAMQGAHLALTREQFNASTPMGQIAAKEKALGRALSADERGLLLGIDNISPLVKIQLNSLYKEQEQISQAMNKSMAEGSWTDTDKNGKPNPLLERAALINQTLSDLSKSAGKFSAVKPPVPVGEIMGDGKNKSATGQVNQAGNIPAENKQEKLIQSPRGIDLAKRQAEIEKMNTLSGSTRRNSIVKEKASGLDSQFSSQLSKIQPGMSRTEKFAVLQWIDDNSDIMTPAQLKQVRDAKNAAGI